MRIPQNVSSEAEVKNFFMLHKSYVPSQGIQVPFVLNHRMSYEICDAMMSISP